MDDRDSRPSGESQRFEQLFSTSTSGQLAPLTEWELVMEDELAGREDAPESALGLPECLLAVQAILLERHAAEEIDPYFADLVHRTEIPDEALPLLREYTPDELGPRVDTLDDAEMGDVLAVAVLLELKLHNDLVYWAPLLDAGRRGEFTTHLGAFREALLLGQLFEDRLRELGLAANPLVLRLQPLLDQIRDALPREDTLPPVPPPRATPDVAAPPSSPARTPFWTPMRAATWSTLAVLMVVGTAISLLNRPVEITDQYTGDEPLEQVIRSGRLIQVVVPVATAGQPETERRATLERIAADLPLPRRATVDFSTPDGVAIAERSASGEIRLLPAR
jgi:hypothetical protein